MAKRRKRGGNNFSLPRMKVILSSSAALFFAYLLLVLLNDALGGGLPLPSAKEVSTTLDTLYQNADLSPAPANSKTNPSGSGDINESITIHYIDVEQADCELIQTPEQTILIDAGDIGEGDRVISYLRSQNVESIDLLIATHPHADHIGGMADVVDAFDIGKIIFSDVPKDITPTTKTYEKLLDSISNKGKKITKAVPGTQYDLGGGAELKILAPVKPNEEDLNENSVVCRLTYGDTAFLFDGDAGKDSENEMLDRYPASELTADVLKLGHHGSSTASQSKWLSTVNPKLAIASCGLDNKYGHPHAEVLKRLQTLGIQLYRTDETGTVVVQSDGSELTVETEKNAA